MCDDCICIVQVHVESMCWLEGVMMNCQLSGWSEKGGCMCLCACALVERRDAMLSKVEPFCFSSLAHSI